jgi:hypothetical protein
MTHVTEIVLVEEIAAAGDSRRQTARKERQLFALHANTELAHIDHDPDSILYKNVLEWSVVDWDMAVRHGFICC